MSIRAAMSSWSPDGSVERMQENTMKDCIPVGSSYLTHSLKLDSLPLICKQVSEIVLRDINTAIELNAHGSLLRLRYG